ncbi:MAG: hypothetical protein F6K63_14785 [Moorea sp. SIO1G6]|nr:hypothetical protein [Moorena sp. SIO1G6]
MRYRWCYLRCYQHSAVSCQLKINLGKSFAERCPTRSQMRSRLHWDVGFCSGNSNTTLEVDFSYDNLSLDVCHKQYIG